MAASTAPPIIHRQVLPNGSAILPVLANPGPEHTAPPAAPGQPPAAPASVVSVDAEAFAAAGGRMTSWEWQQLQRFRDAVTECRSMPDASPLVLQAEQLASHSLTTGEPGVSFGVKQAVLTPHRRLMDSVCRFAFPATHGLLAGGWQMQSVPQAAGNAATAGGPAGQAAAQGSVPVQSAQQVHPAAAEHTRQQRHQQQCVLLPVPVPAVQQLSNHFTAVTQNRAEVIQTVSTVRGGSDHGSSGGCLQPQSSRPAAAPAAVPAASNWPADPALQLRAQAAAGAAAVAVSQQSDRASEHRQSWGSAGGADPQQPGQPQQQSWGTAVAGPESITASHAEASTASGLSMGGILQLTGMAGPPPSCVQQAATAAGQGQAAQQAGVSTDEVHRLRHWRPDGASSDGQQAGANIQQSTPPEQQPQQQHMLEGTGSIPAAPATAGILDLPALWQPSSSNSRGLAAGSCAGAGEGVPAAAAPQQQQQQQALGTATTADRIEAHSSSCKSAGGQAIAALQRALVEDFVLYEEASAARQHVVGILVAVEQGDAAAGQRLLAPACAELIAATAPAAVPNRLAPFLSSPAVASAAANARAAGAGPAEVASAAAVAAAEEYCRHVQGISRLLGSASSSRAALEASPRQVRQLRQQQQALLVRALQRVSNRVPWLSRLLTPLQQSLGPDGTHGQAAAAPVAASSEAAEAQQDGQAGLRRAGEQQAGAAQGQQAQEGPAEPPALHLTSPAEADAGQHELQAAVVELIMQLPELLHGLPGPALLTYEQYRQRYKQAQQLAAHAMQLLLPGEGQDEGAAAASAADGVAAELAASGLLAAASAAMAASQAPPSAADPGSTGGAPGQHQTSAGHLFANILDSLRGPGAGVMAEHAAGSPGAAGGFLSRTAAFAAANRLADGLIRPPPVMPPSSLGLSRAGSLGGAGQLGAWRLPAGAAGSGASTAGFMTPAGGAAAAAAGAAGLGMFAPTGTGALLSGGLLAEGGVAGDSILDDVLHGNVRRITCHGLYELCAALAQPAGGVSSPPTAAQQQPQQRQGGGEAGCEDAPPAHSQMETDDSNHSSEGRLTGQHVAEAVATVAAAAVAVESNRRSSSTHSMGPPAPPGALAGCKRRLSSAQEEQAQLERPLKH